MFDGRSAYIHKFSFNFSECINDYCYSTVRFRYIMSSFDAMITPNFNWPPKGMTVRADVIQLITTHVVCRIDPIKEARVIQRTGYIDNKTLTLYFPHRNGHIYMYLWDNQCYCFDAYGGEMHVYYRRTFYHVKIDGTSKYNLYESVPCKLEAGILSGLGDVFVIWSVLSVFETHFDK